VNVCSYVKYCEMDGPSDDIDVVMDKTAQRIRAMMKGTHSEICLPPTSHRIVDRKLLMTTAASNK